MNTFSNGEWGKEERKSLPIKKGDSFDIRIRAHDDRFQVSRLPLWSLGPSGPFLCGVPKRRRSVFQIIIDQKEFKDYEHRLPLNTITHLSIDGDLYLNHVHWGGKYYVSCLATMLLAFWRLF